VGEPLEADNEVARAIIRRRDRLVVLPYDAFEDARTIFHDGVTTYYIDRGGHSFHTGDHWQQHVYFRPASHLMETIIDLLADVARRQDAKRHAAKVREIIIGP